MSQPFRVAKLLSDEHWPAFHTLALDTRTTVDDLHGWLAEHGYRVSRGAVHNYPRYCRRGLLFDLRAKLGTRSDGALRRQLAAWAARLSGVGLMSVVFQAAFLATVEGTRRRGPSKGL